ncbi:neuronal PAS domain-containing protein 4B-like [Haliotis rufescens]|uniref:neuronal PAS domain-containing protein 4B-like n=1 Tax=Haliotis rufescens TaxID=6454 RepID=UPI00201F8641|nr:neuronal PAS domain-containing protein 4B-like [Haliotis rufescens]
MAPSPVEELVLYDLDRSNKGASKQRRDQINAEIAVMRDLLPLAESARQRLSQLQIMSLSCVYIRKCNVLDKLFRSSGQSGKDNLNVPSCDFFQALTGFLLIATREGKLIYISENVTDYLGHSMVDMKTQGDSLYDIVDKRDHGTVQAQLLQAGTDGERDTRDVAFFCRMNMSRSLKRQAGFGDVKVMYVKGHFVSHPGPESSSEQQVVFMGTCTPLITPDLKENLIQNNTMVFKTVHQLDLSFLEVSHTAEYHLGYSNGELFRRSWYSLLHPEDLQEARDKHVQLIRSNHEMGCMMIVRMIRADNSIFWVNVVMHIKQASVSNSDDPVIACVNQVISEQEAYQFKLQSQMFQFYPPRGEPWQQTVPCPTIVQEQDTRWLQPSSGFQATTRMRATQAGPVYPSQSGCQTGPFMPYIDPRLRRGDQLKNGGSGQTERLKEMLKRKIKGPCKPAAKVPRLSPSGNDDKLSGQGFDFGSSSFMIPNLDNFRDSFPALSVAQGGWAEHTQVMSQSNSVFSAVALQQKKNILMEPSSLSPGSMLQEQVVPDVSALPESYLTPDPSPASSPDPNSKVFKVDVITPSKSTRPCPKTIIEELKQLANCVGPKIKSEPLPPTPTKKRKELPVIDPFEVESFFWDFDVSKPNLQCPEDAKVNLPCHEVSKKVASSPVKAKKNLPLIDATELEEFFNHFNGENSPYVDAQMLVDSAGTFFEQQALVKEEDCPPVIKVECSNSPASQSMSPFSMTSCELSEEEELLEELASTPLEMTLSVTVKDEYLPLSTPKPCGSYEEEDFFQIQKLLTSLAPNNGAIALSEETQ